MGATPPENPEPSAVDIAPLAYGMPPAWGPPPPPAPGWYPPPPPPPPRRSRLVPVMIAAGVAVALAAGGVGAGIGVALRGSSSSVPQVSMPSSGTSHAASGTADAAAIAAAIDPSIVDINDSINGTPAAGTGIIITAGGQVLTNNHVIDGATNITAQVDGQGPTYSVKVLGYDSVDDVALLQLVNAPTQKPAPLASSSVLQAGDQVVALGNAEGRGGTPAVATGTVTALNQTVTASDGATSETLNGTIEIQANIVPGDSGGPLVDAAGEVVGMDTAGSTSSGGPFTSGQQTIGYAIPIETAVSIARQIESGSGTGNVVIGGSGPLIGVDVANASSVSPLSPSTASGAQIVQVIGGSPAAEAGLQPGDVIVSFNGNPITSVADLSAALRGERPGQSVQLGWLDTSGTQHTSTITLAAGPPN
jgi:S1-C subfamily serine protease